jgi:hypothetical protein
MIKTDQKDLYQEFVAKYIASSLIKRRSEEILVEWLIEYRRRTQGIDDGSVQTFANDLVVFRILSVRGSWWTIRFSMAWEEGHRIVGIKAKEDGPF